MAMESCQLAELKYAFFSTTGRKTKKLPRSKLFLCTVLKHGLLEGSTILPRSAGKRELYSIFMLTFAFYSSARTPAFNFFWI